MNQINDGINRLITRSPSEDFPPHPDFPIGLPPIIETNGNINNEIDKVVKKVSNVDHNLEKGMREMTNEVCISVLVNYFE